MRKAVYLAPLMALALANPAAAKTCEVVIDSDDMMRFNKSEITVSSDCDKVELTLTHSGNLGVAQMGHNWVLAKTDEWEALNQDAVQAGLDNEYLPPDDDRVLVHTELIGGGESTTVTFDLSKLDKDGDYTYFCSFPGHAFQMKGSFKIE